jgi:internalin A
VTIALLIAGLALPTASPPEGADPKDAITALKGMHASLHHDADGFVTSARLHPQGGSLEDALPHLRRLTRLTALALYTDNLSTDGFLALDKMPALIEVELHAAKVPDGPTNLGAAPCPRLPWDKLPRVRTIRLSGGGIGDAQLRDVAAAPVVQNLFLGEVAVTEKGLAHLREIRTLELLCVQSSKVTADGVKTLVGIEKLKSLTLSATALERDGFRLLEGMTGLEYLSLESTKATDADVAHLAALAKLTHLDLGYNPGVTDAGLKHLTGLRRLTGLRLYGTKVTDDGAADLKAALPKLKIGK